MGYLPSTYRLVFLGYGRLRRALGVAADRSGLGERITFVDAVSPDELPAWLPGADIGMIPYQAHGLNYTLSTPNKLFEYMHAGVPVVANALPEIRRFLEELGFGITCDSSNPRAMASAIQRIAEDETHYREMREKALAASEVFSWENQEESIVSMLGALPAQ